MISRIDDRLNIAIIIYPVLFMEYLEILFLRFGFLNFKNRLAKVSSKSICIDRRCFLVGGNQGSFKIVV